ncbi:MAG: hypothetical protein PHC34_01890 [Candidatus Gastranaerophilales bacterium]|nr:hypothetical protein [Candidatus Gastranaerophilales bacterium]
MKLNPYSIIKINPANSMSKTKKPHLQSLRGYNGYDREADIYDDWLIRVNERYTKLKSKFVLYKAKKALKTYIKEDPPISKEEKKELIKELFPSGFRDIKLTQSDNIGDCYLIASLQALVNSTSDKLSFEDFFSNIIRKQKDGTFKVTFPGQNLFPVKVAREEAEYGQVAPGDNFRKLTYEHIKPMNADIGFKIIERAYGRLIRQLEIFNSLGQMSKKRIEDTLVLIDGGFGHEALQNLTGWKPVLIKKPCKMRRFLDKFAKNPDNYVMTVGTVSERSAPTIFHVIFTNDGDKIVYMDEAREILTRHAYALKSVNPDKKEVFITDPNIPSKEIKVSYNNFLKYFSCVSGVKVPKKSAF